MSRAGRKAMKVTAEELRQKIAARISALEGNDYGDDDGIDLETLRHDAQIDKDLGKIQFDSENALASQEDGRLCGYQQMGELNFLGVKAGGDWEHPIFFILYLDHKGKLRGYVPESGNVFNRKARTAFGNDMDQDETEARHMGFDGYEDLHARAEYDWDLIAQNIQGRIMVEA